MFVCIVDITTHTLFFSVAHQLMQMQVSTNKVLNLGKGLKLKWITLFSMQSLPIS